MLAIIPPLTESQRGEDRVARELRRWASEPFERRRANCALSVLAYVERACGRRLRWPRPLGRFAWRLVWNRPQRLEAVARRAMRQLGCNEVERPERGDVGLVELRGTGLTACICTRGARPGEQAMWAARHARGVVIRPAMPDLAWRLRCPKR